MFKYGFLNYLVNGKMKRINAPWLILVVLTLALLFLVPVSYSFNNKTSSDEIERIEYRNNSKITYFKNGSKLVEVTSKLTMTSTFTMESSTGTAQVIAPEPNPINWIEILGILGTISAILSFARTLVEGY
jgi:hypothetical protein